MPKKRNFLGGMQNYNPENGQYESRLTKADGTPATKENMHGGEDKKRSFEIFKKQVEITPRPEWAKKIDDEMKPVFEKAREKNAKTESRLKMLAEKSGIDYNEIKNEYINRLDKITKEKRFDEEEIGDIALDLLEKDINSKRMGNTKFEKKTDLQTNEDIDWDLAEKNEKINGKNAKSKTRKDKYGNPLVSDEAFMIGYEAGKAYLEGSLKYNTLDSLKRSNVFLGYLSQYINNAITNNGYNPDLDTTYADENEIIGAIVGEEVDMESYEINKTKGWMGRKYNGYKPKDTTFEEINAKRMGTNQ